MEETLLALRERVRGLKDMGKKPPNVLLNRSPKTHKSMRRPLPTLRNAPTAHGSGELPGDAHDRHGLRDVPDSPGHHPHSTSPSPSRKPSTATQPGGSKRSRRPTSNNASALRRASMRQLPKLRVLKGFGQSQRPGRLSFQGNPSGDADGERLPFSEEEYNKLWTVFNQLDVDGGGDLSMKEVSRIPEMIGRKDLVIDRATFKRIDKDRSGTVDFIEMLRCLYPQWPAAGIKAAVNRYSTVQADTKKTGVDRTQIAQDWRVLYGAENVKELTNIFALYSEELAPGVRGITKKSLRKHLSSMSEDGIDELFDQHATVGSPKGRRLSSLQAVVARARSPQSPTVPKHITLDVFARIMEEIYTKQMDKRKEPLLYFQKTDGPIYPIALPRL